MQTKAFELGDLRLRTVAAVCALLVLTLVLALSMGSDLDPSDLSILWVSFAGLGGFAAGLPRNKRLRNWMDPSVEPPPRRDSVLPYLRAIQARQHRDRGLLVSLNRHLRAMRAENASLRTMLRYYLEWIDAGLVASMSPAMIDGRNEGHARQAEFLRAAGFQPRQRPSSTEPAKAPSPGAPEVANDTAPTENTTNGPPTQPKSRRRFAEPPPKEPTPTALDNDEDLDKTLVFSARPTSQPTLTSEGIERSADPFADDAEETLIFDRERGAELFPVDLDNATFALLSQQAKKAGVPFETFLSGLVEDQLNYLDLNPEEKERARALFRAALEQYRPTEPGDPPDGA